MSHFNFKSLGFYGGAIVFVVVLFASVTNYGQKHLKAPAAIDGPYSLSFGQNVPYCLKSNSLVLNIQQSGSYLSASLLPNNTNNGKGATAATKPSLTGQMRNQQLSLSGTAPSLSVCNNAVSQGNHPSQLKILGQVEGKNLQGKLTLSSLPGDIGFIAQREAPAHLEKSTSH
jgi:hypothetical protein